MGLARKNAGEIFHQRFFGIQRREHFHHLGIQINGAVLLAAAADGENFSERDLVFFHPRKNQIERRDPHLRRAVFDERVAAGQHAVLGFELRQLLVKIQRVFIDDLARVEVNDHGAQALRAGIESKKKFGHVIK